MRILIRPTGMPNIQKNGMREFLLNVLWLEISVTLYTVELDVNELNEKSNQKEEFAQELVAET